jgi:light-regulated signal transduction histidine kinase (bacteriophytochrome)
MHTHTYNHMPPFPQVSELQTALEQAKEAEVTHTHHTTRNIDAGSKVCVCVCVCVCVLDD